MQKNILLTETSNVLVLELMPHSSAEMSAWHHEGNRLAS